MLSSTLENNFDIPQFVKMACRVMHVQRKPLGAIHCTMKMLKYTEFLMVGYMMILVMKLHSVQCYIQ